MLDKVDVCVVTRDGKLPKGLECLPVKNIIIETSFPIGLARKRAIEKVSTEWFAFIDDDVEITPEWFPICSLFIKDGVGAVNDTDSYKGLGVFDRVIFNGPIIPKEVTYKGRLNGNNILIKTDLVRDWFPDENRRCYEDLTIGRHVLSKGYKKIVTPALCYHGKDWGSVKRSALWARREYTKMYSISVFRIVVRKIIEPLKHLVYGGILYSIFTSYSNFWLIIGILQSQFKERRV